MNNNVFYMYDPNTFEYVGVTVSNYQPDNSTNISINGIINPVFNPETQTWGGDSIDEILNDNESSETPTASVLKTIASLQKQFDTTTATLMAQIAQLQTQVGGDK